MGEEKQDLASWEGVERVRKVWHHGEWYWSVVSVLEYLTGSPKPSNYWHMMRQRMQGEGARETLEQVIELPMPSADGRMRKTDAVNQLTLLRLLQSVPSSKVEVFRLWLAQVGQERLEEMQQVDILEQKREDYRRQGRSEEWIEARIQSFLTRNAWTDEVKERGVDESLRIAQLTSEMNKHTFDLSTAQHKVYKGLTTRENLSEHKTRMELILTSLAEETATGLHQRNDSQGFPALRGDVIEAGDTAGDARRLVEKTLGGPVVSRENFLLESKRTRFKKTAKKLPYTQSSLFDSPPVLEELANRDPDG